MNLKKTDPIALIPAYKPEPCIVDTVSSLLASGCFRAIVMINDGSGPDFDSLFTRLAALGVTVLSHAINLGKGMALRTGFNYIACAYPDSIGVVTLDADGQHLVQDVLRVADHFKKNSESLILGSRRFGRDVPLRSRFGNKASRGVMLLVGGIRLTDTQTGLRGIPLFFLPTLLRLNTTGYDFELDMLMQSRQVNLPIIEVPISTVYLEGNTSSHFNPFFDSLKIYMVFLRFNVSSLISVLIDYSIFSLIFISSGNIIAGQSLARLCAGSVNYCINRNFVFKSSQRHSIAVLLYFGWLCLLGFVSYGIIKVLHSTLGINVYAAKIISEGLLYIMSFIAQRDFIFPSQLPKKASFKKADA